MSEGEILTSEEKEALQQTAESSAEEVVNPNSMFEVVDFSAIQNTTSKFPGLQPILELFILECAQQFSKFLHRRVTLRLGYFQSDSFGHYCEKFPESSIYNLLFMKSHQLHTLINMPHEFLDFSLNALYGGHYKEGAPGYKNVGKVGTKIVHRFLKIIFSIMQSVWADIVRFDFEIVKTLTNPNIITKISRHEMFSITRYSIQFSDFSTWIDILLPQSLLEQLKGRLKAGDERNSDRINENVWQQNLKQEILNARVGVIARLPSITLTLKEVLNLKVGDELPISDPREVDICAGEKKLYRALAGVGETQRVVKILGNY